MNLEEWTVNFVKHKDLIQRKLERFEVKQDHILFFFKDKKQAYFIREQLDSSVLKDLEKHEHRAIVCLNNEENFRFLINNWKKLSSLQNLSIIFVNLKLDSKWMINPVVHSRIADADTLELGLKAMYEGCEGKRQDILLM